MPELYPKPCDVADCQTTLISKWAECQWCWKVYCNEHAKAAFHKCAQLPNGLVSLDAKREINNQAYKEYFGKVLEQVGVHQDLIINEAQSFRPGHPCQLIIPHDLDAFIETTRIGIFNLHFLITFDDGIKWLLRVRQNKGHRPSAEIADAGVESEVATLSVLKDFGLPVSQGYVPPSFGEQDDGQKKLPFDYFFCDFLEGTPFKVPRADWFGNIDLQGDRLLHFIHEYAKVQIKLSQHPLPHTKIGCLYYKDIINGDHAIKTGPIVSRGTFMNTKPPYFLGPFSSNKERYLAKIDATLRYVRHHASKTLRSLDEYLWHLELRELVGACKALEEVPTELYIKHDDEKGDHFLVDEKDNVTGIIDWEWAYATTKSEAFATPWLFYRDLNYLHGSNKLTSDEELLIDAYNRHDRPDLGECVRNGRLYARLHHIGSYDRTYKKSGFMEVFGNDLPEGFDPPEADVDWRVYMMNRYRDDKGLIKMMKRCKWTVERAERIGWELA